MSLNLNQQTAAPVLSLLAAIVLLGCGSSDAESRHRNKAIPMKAPSDLTEDELSRRWRDESLRYVAAVNAFVERGMRDGWENVGDEPEDTRQPLAEAVLSAVRQANESRDSVGLREKFPPAHGPFLDMLDENGQDLPVVALLDDGRILVRIGAPYENGRVVVIDDLKIKPLPAEIITIGRSPDRRYFAIARAAGVDVRDGWEGPVVARFNWPTGLEGIPAEFNAEPINGVPTITRLIPFPQGDRVLLVSPESIFVLTQGGAIRIPPTARKYEKSIRSSRVSRWLTTCRWCMARSRQTVS